MEGNEGRDNGTSFNINFRVSYEQLDEIDKWVREKKYRNRTHFIHEALREYLLKLEREQQYEYRRMSPPPSDKGGR